MPPVDTIKQQKGILLVHHRDNTNSEIIPFVRQKLALLADLIAVLSSFKQYREGFVARFELQKVV